MAGRGPAPKPSDRRARGNKDPIPTRTVAGEPVPQPPLTDGIEWNPRTREWWSMWGASPLSSDFTATDWSELLDTAMLHTAYWGGELKHAAELRLRAAKFGATPEDRQRLRIVYADADAKDAGRPSRAASPSRARYGNLLSLPGGAEGSGA
jgi:hypothetical protein